MFPFAFEWQWDLGHLVFMGLFYSALGVLVMSLGYVFFQTMTDLWIGKTAASEEHHEEH